jgi:hypothetical protein
LLVPVQWAMGKMSSSRWLGEQQRRECGQAVDEEEPTSDDERQDHRQPSPGVAEPSALGPCIGAYTGGLR